VKSQANIPDTLHIIPDIRLGRYLNLLNAHHIVTVKNPFSYIFVAWDALHLAKAVFPSIGHVSRSHL
jgi:hypothetical protein